MCSESSHSGGCEQTSVSAPPVRPVDFRRLIAQDDAGAEGKLYYLV
jgi:hypothetical protein